MKNKIIGTLFLLFPLFVIYICVGLSSGFYHATVIFLGLFIAIATISSCIASLILGAYFLKK